MVNIDEEKCTGCGSCADACHEGAIEMVNGKARLTREDHCDGLGNCIPECPAGAITLEVREAEPFTPETQDYAASADAGDEGHNKVIRKMVVMPVLKRGELAQWPIKIKLVPTKAPYFDGADLLVAADCTAFAHSNFHRNFIKGRAVVIGCPKFDAGDYIDKLAAIIANNDIRKVMVVRMEVPCCSEMERIVKAALVKSQKRIPYRVVVLAADGAIVEG